MSNFWEWYKAAAIGGPVLGSLAYKDKLKIKDDDSKFERGLKETGQTWLDWNSRLVKGLSKSIEGVVDLGLGIAAGATDIFGADKARRQLEEKIKYDWTSEQFKDFDTKNKDSALRGNKAGEFVGNVTEGIGGMVPALATGGTAGMVLTGVSAAGGGAEEALNKDANIGAALGYGGMMGGIEALTEKIGGFTFGGGTSLLGKATAGTKAGKFLSGGIGKFVGDFVSEGTEEVISDLSSPLAKKAMGVDNRSLKEQYGEVRKGLGETFLVGGTVGSVISGGQNVMRNNANKERGGARASRADDYLKYIGEVSKNYKGTDADAKYSKAVNEAFLEAERELTQMDESSRKNYLHSLEKTPFKLAFDTNGKFIGAAADNVNASSITNNLKDLSANLKYKAIDRDTKVSTDAEDVKTLIEDVLGDRAAVVISDAMDQSTRATYDVDTGIIYVNNNVELDETFSSAVLAIHEITHTTEGTIAYDDLATLVTSVAGEKEFQKRLESMGYSAFDEEGLSKKQVEYIARTEIFADLAGHLLSTPSALAKLRARDKGLFDKLKASIESARDKTTSREGKRALNKVLKVFNKALDASHGGVKLSDLKDDEEKKENTEQEPGVDNERNSKITAGMTDAERYEILKNREIENVPMVEHIPTNVLDNILEISSWDDLNKYFKSEKRKLIDKIATEFGVYNKEYFNKDTQMSFVFSKNNFRETYNKQAHNYVSFAKIFSVFNNVIESAVGIEIHNNPKHKPDPTLENMFVLVSAYQDENYIVPIKLEVKKFKDKKNNLYVIISSGKIKTTEVWKQGNTIDGVTQNSRSVNISISKLFEKINPFDKSFIKYIPNGFLSEEQLKVKQEALEEDRLNDEKRNASKNERKSKIPEKNGVTWDDLTKGDDSFKDAEDNSDIIVHPPAPKKKTTEKEKPKAEAKKETKKAKKPLKITKALTEDEARNIVAYIMEDHFKEITEDTKMAYLPKNVRKDVFNKLTHIAGTNDMEAYVGKVYEVAELLCNEAVIREQYDISDRADVDEAYRTVEILDSYKGKINLEAIREDIKSVYDTRAAHLIRTWGAKKTRGVSTDVIKEELAEYGIRILRDNEADIFTDMISIYDQAESIIDEAEKSITIKVKDLFVDDPAGKSNLIENVADDLHTLFNKNLEREYFKTYSKLLSVCRKFDDLKKGTYVNATENEDAALRSVYDNLKTLRGGLLSVKSITDTFKYLSVWYSDKNKSLEGRIDSETQELIREIAFRPEGPINVIELKNILKVLQRVYSTLENYTKVYRDGNYQDIGKIVEKNMETADNAAKNDNTITRFYRNGTKGFWYNISDPQFVCELLDGYKQGFAMDTLKELREGEIKYSKAKIDILKEYENFVQEKDNRKYIDSLSKRSVNIGNISVPMDIAISAYMTNKRCHAQKGLQMNGFEYKAPKGDVIKLEGLTSGDISGIESNFTHQDKTFISIVENIYKKCKNYKYDTDMIRLGFSNIVKDYYYPIFRVHATSIESSEMYFAADSVNTVYFNKNTVQGAKQRLVVKSVLDTMVNHIEGIARYTGYAIPVDNFNKLWNYNTVENKNNPVTIKNKLDAFWGKGSAYIVNLVNDVQGKRLEQQPGAKIINWVRGSYATYQLGANPKVWVTQLSSYLAAFNKLSSDSMLKAFTISGEDVDEFCTLAEIRNNDMQVAKAQSVSDKISKKAEFFMKPISKVDRMVVCKLFAACQLEINKRNGLEIGSEENKVKAGELLTELIFETQQNSFASERSEIMRRSGEIIKSFTMFSADAMKLWSRWFGAIGKHHTLRRELYLANKNNLDTSAIEKELSKAKKNVAKTTTSVMTVAMFMALVAMAFRHLYNKDDEENDAVTFAKDFGANLIGMFPFIRDAYSYFSDGYEVGTFATDTYNTVLKSIKTTFGNINDLIDGKYVSKQTLNKNYKDLVFSMGQVSGLPTRNLYNVTTGLINRVFEGSLGYRINNALYGKSYSADLSEAIEEGDETKVHTILSLASTGDGKYSSAAADVLSKLYGEGYKCLPRTIGDKLTVAGVEYELTGKQYRTINQEYGQATDLINSMVSSSEFGKLSFEAQSKAIKFANDYYFAVATEKGLDMRYNSDSSYYKKLVYGKLIDVKVLAMASARVHQIKTEAKDGENVREKIRDYIESLRISANEKYLLFNYFGYTSMVDKDKIKSHIRSNSKLTAEEKEYLLKRYN
ncbi:MAG: hypothetical protein IJ445_02740 [Clostridia bacterium]|nr:hypothetical protein [Clostridia bacterium]